MSTTKADYLRNLDASSYLREMFNDNPELCFFAKDRDFSFTMCHRTLLAKLGIARESEIIGLTDHEIFERTMADKYWMEDSAAPAQIPAGGIIALGSYLGS